MGFQFQLFAPLLTHMRGNIREKPGFYCPLDGMSENEIGSIKSLCHLLKANGLLEEWQAQRSGSRIGGRVATTDMAIDFLTGGWLEQCVRVFIQQFLNLDGASVEVAQNVVIQRANGRGFEMDILLWIDGSLYWWEAKAGRYKQQQLNRYRQVREELGLKKKHCTLVLANPDAPMSPKEEAQNIGFRVISPHHIARRVEEIESWHR